jgi:hypothetical protein
MNSAAILNPTDVELPVWTKTIHIKAYYVQNDKSTSESVSPRITTSRSNEKSPASSWTAMLRSNSLKCLL